jgi:hypothetical protein
MKKLGAGTALDDVAVTSEVGICVADIVGRQAMMAPDPENR